MSDTPDPHPPASTEVTVWKGSTSQWVHWLFYVMCLLLAAGIVALAVTTQWMTTRTAGLLLILPGLAVVLRFFVTRSTSYELTTERILKSTGVLNRRKDSIELYRVRDYTILQPFFLRMMGLGNLRLVTSDATLPVLNIEAIPQIETIREQLREAVERARDRKRVRQMDVDSVDGDLPGDLGHGGQDFHA